MIKEDNNKGLVNRQDQRELLHKTIWNIADRLRGSGSVDGWDFKQYVLGFLFYRYLSENLTNYLNKNEHDSGKKNFDYAQKTDEYVNKTIGKNGIEGIINTKGFFIYPSQLFCNVKKNAKNDENLNETLEKIFNAIAATSNGKASEKNFKGLFDDLNVNSSKLGSTVNERNQNLVKIIDGISNMNLGSNYDLNEIDIFGDAYEYLIGMYASHAGKSGGEYYTPQEVAYLLAKLTLVGKKHVKNVYDPACGSGSLLLKFAKVLGKDNVRKGFFGQEINQTTYNLCRINMFLHNIDYAKFNIECADTLTKPLHYDNQPFEVIVSNPPYAIKWEGDSNPCLINDPRFSPAGILAPKNNADMAFIMHSLSWLATNGVAAIVCFPGILYRHHAEQKIRKYLITSNFIDCIIQLPPNLFYGTSIATCIMILKKSKIDNSTLFIDASNYYQKVTNNNKLSDKNIDDILKLFIERKDIKYVSKLVDNAIIASHDYNLSVSTYVEKKDTREIIDIKKLNSKIDEIVKKEDDLRLKINKIIKGIES